MDDVQKPRSKQFSETQNRDQWLWVNRVYPDPSAVFACRPRPLQDIKDSCDVFLDASMLLRPYTFSSKTLAELDRILRKLKEQKRLYVPAQAAREFAKNRPKNLADLVQSLQDTVSRLNRPGFKTHPLLIDLAEYQELEKLDSAIADSIAAYKKTTAALVARIREWTFSDPVSMLYAEVFADGVVVESSTQSGELVEDWEFRKLNSIPPGYKDEGPGDLLIWRTIIEHAQKTKRDCIFVCNDLKTDWWHQAAGSPLYPRFELLVEYSRASQGSSFGMVTFAELLELFGADREIVEEAKQEEVTSARGGDSTLAEFQGLQFESWLLRELGADRLSYYIGRGFDYVATRPDGEATAILCISIDEVPFAEPTFAMFAHRIKEAWTHVSTGEVQGVVVVCAAADDERGFHALENVNRARLRANIIFATRAYLWSTTQQRSVFASEV